MSSSTRDLMIANSILSAAQEIYHNYMDNASAKDAGQEYLAILLSITMDDFNTAEITCKHDDGSSEKLYVNTLIARAIKSVAGASSDLRLEFRLKLKQYIDALVYKRKARLVKRYREELRASFIDALDDDCGRDQEQMRGAFETFAELLRIMKIRNTPDAAKQLAEMEKMLKEMQERGIGTQSSSRALAQQPPDEEEQ